MASWRDLHSQLDAFAKATAAKPDGEADREVTYRVMGNLPVIVSEAGSAPRAPCAGVSPTPRTGNGPTYPCPLWTIETTKAFASAFLDGQRGIVLFKTFSEAPDIEGPTQQHVIAPGGEQALAAAFVWRSFDIGAAVPLLACCLVTVPANALIATLPTDRMPAFIAPEDWKTWLGEKPASVDEVKWCLKTVEGVKWTMTKEERAKQPRQRPTVSDPGWFF